MSAPSIFISYRRQDSSGDTGRIYARLADHFGKNAVFRDLEGIRPGQKFAQVIEESNSSSSALVVVIGRQWLSVADKNGNRRLDNPADWVKQEVGEALRAGIVVIPALVQGAKMPDADELPPALKPLAQVSAVEIHDDLFEESVKRLVSALEGAVQSRWRPRRIALASAGIAAAVAMAWAVLFGPLSRLLSPPDPIKISASAPKKIPASLKHSIRAVAANTPAAFYWFRVDATNSTRTPFTVKVNFRVNSGPVMPREGASFSGTIPPKRDISQPFSQPFDPDFQFSSYLKPEDLDVVWSAVDDTTKRSIHTEHTTIRILPRNVVAWDLTTPDGKPVSRALLLASLSAWTQNPADKLREQARLLFNRLPKSLSDEAYALRWFSSAYQEFARGRTFSHLNGPFPPAGEQEIRAPEDMLAAQRPDPLEAALYLIALSNSVPGDLRLRPVLMAVQDQDAAVGQKTFLLAWCVDNKWRGLDMAHSWKFEDNEPKSTQRVKDVLVGDGKMLDELNRTGVYVNDATQTIALDLKQAAHHFGIQPLP